MGSVENKSHESTSAIPTTCLSNINANASSRPITEHTNQTAGSGNRGQCPNSSTRVKRLEFVRRHYEGLQGFRKSMRRCVRGASAPTGLRPQPFGRSTLCLTDRRGVRHRLRRQIRIRAATSPAQWRHSVERETNRDHQSHARLRHTGGKRWQRLGALNHRENFLVEYGRPRAALDVPR